MDMPRFSLLQALALLTCLGGLLALTSLLHLWSLPFWLVAVLLCLILHPHRSVSRHAPLKPHESAGRESSRTDAASHR